MEVKVLLLFITLYLREGLSAYYRAELGSDLRLQRAKRQSKASRPVLKVTDYHVRCTVVSRYAVTNVQSSIWNQLSVTKEAAFQVDLPSSAFISNFTITSGGKVYVAQVKERAAARKIYDAAKKQGKTAGLVATKEREVEKFRVAVSVPPGAQMSFSMTYEDLLPRRLGRYELSVGLRPGQPVQNLTLDISITERTGISFITVLPLKKSRLLSNSSHGGADTPESARVERTSCCARVHYSPSVQQQTSISPKGLDADFVVQYDVELSDLIGDVQLFDGFFVHYFAPRGLPVVPKDVIFVIDVSGSMIGTKIKQTKQAMSTILADLREGDHFNIITFSDKVHTWRKGRTVRATRQNVRDAKDFVKRIMAEGWTNINAALLSAAQLVNPPSSGSSTHLHSRRVPLVIFLTDGEATIGVTAGDTILNNAKKALGSASLFGLAFGDDADFLLLKRLALDNRGVARMVYEDADAVLQLKGFYDEVASPLLSDVQLSYMDDQAYEVTRSLFPNYFQGSELVVAGRVKPGVKDLKVSLSATDSKQRVKVENEVLLLQALGNDTGELLECSAVGLEGISNFVNRLWAYFTIKELLLAKLNSSDPAMQRLLAEKATNLSLKYNFVTPVTSLVVVKPEADIDPTTARPPATTRAPPVKKPHLPSKPRRPPPPTTAKKPPPPPVPSPKTVVATSRKATTASPSSARTAPAPFSGKKPRSDSRAASPPPPAGKVSTSLLSALKTAAPPAPGRLSSSPPQKPAAANTSTSLPTVATGTTGGEDSSTDTPSSLPVLPTLSTSAPDVGGNDTNSSVSEDERIATLLSATYAPMPGVTDGPRLWEAAGLLDVSTSIQIQRKDIDLVKDYDATYDYDYDLNYDEWAESAGTESFVLGSDQDCPSAECPVLLEPPSRLSAQHFSSSVDGDPHFVVQLPKLQQNLCFTVDGVADDVLRLLEDPEKGIIVDGRLAGAPSKHGAENRRRTYFDHLVISAATGSSGEIMVTLSLDAVVVEGEGRDIFTLNQTGSVTRQGVTITVDHHRRCWVELAKSVRFLVLFHYYKHPSYLQMAHLGFYITDGRGLSVSTQGLLGQFQHADMTVTPVKDQQDRLGRGILTRGVLQSGADHLPVSLQDKSLKDSPLKRHSDQCWVVPKAEVERLLGHPYESYVVDRA
ncbi:inter-alpha-trypsin inhibitor heavy chain H6 [Synchiropus splendidus]|uniref:inter-alpha-trypsin inhibitor heavy chain H6 n=1 Tax=Synchiropus splendidus TaxID=270530 RepID=UPI00237E8943|nr:inter-alpha-trypsin inhibitor heavy chain H6 [Synchiropus splendidus]